MIKNVKLGLVLQFNSPPITDSIEANVDSAAVHVETANTQLEKARTYQVRGFCENDD